MRNTLAEYPDYSAEIEALDNGGISAEGIDVKLLYRIINKHKHNARYNKKLYSRYKVNEGGVPIFERTPRFDAKEINNRINNDFFGEIIDFKVGYFAGEAVGYSYSTTKESARDTGGDKAVEAAGKVLTDFVTRNNMYDVDMEITKFSAICGYAGRLFYVDESGNERCMVVEPFECIVLSNAEVTEPRYAVRYYKTKDIHDKTVWKVEFYDNTMIYYYEGNLGNLAFVKAEPHMFSYCPLQIIPNNKEMIGDAEKVLELIDSYDKDLSDCDNDIESFARAMLVFENLGVTKQQMEEAQASGVFKFFTGAANGKAYYLTKDINDTFTENHINRVEKNIYRFSKTPNLNDEQFNSASGISLKFKLTGLETKCGMFEAKMQAAGTYMFKLLAECWGRHLKVEVDPLQCVMDFKRNFPLDVLSEAQAAQAMINAGLPKREAYSMAFSGIDDIDYVMQLIEKEQNGIPPLFDDNDEPGGDDILAGENNGGDGK
ncbi:MAG: phage portal protein [bacterium]|nr:phage portal protein [bacterium]